MTAPRRTRIVATLGPATDRPGVLEALVAAGVDVARINFSHGTGDEHRDRIRRLRETAARHGRNVAVLADLPGPKLRVILATARVLIAGATVAFAAESNDDAIGVTEPDVLRDVRPGHRVLMDDGRLLLTVTHATPERVEATVGVGGPLLPYKGFNLPDTPLSIPALTIRDQAALAVAAEVGVDWLALSFVRDPEAADELRRAAHALGCHAKVLAKVERPEAVARAAAIVRAFDAIMVARGDLGVEIPLEQVPIVQKRLIDEARAAGKPVVTATDMLDSMQKRPRPTRAEASDVANAIFDGTDAVMLSGETAVGDYPVEAVACMDRIARQTEGVLSDRDRLAFDFFDHKDADMAAVVVELARSARVEAIIVPTISGRTARQLSRHRPTAEIVAPVPGEAVRRQLALVWGVRPVPLAAELPPGADRIHAGIHAAFSAGAVREGQRVAVLAGHPVEGGPRTPTIRLLKVGPGGDSEEP